MARENLRGAKGAVDYLARHDREALARLEKPLEEIILSLASDQIYDINNPVDIVSYS